MAVRKKLHKQKSVKVNSGSFNRHKLLSVVGVVVMLLVIGGGLFYMQVVKKGAVGQAVSLGANSILGSVFDLDQNVEKNIPVTVMFHSQFFSGEKGYLCTEKTNIANGEGLCDDDDNGLGVGVDCDNSDGIDKYGFLAQRDNPGVNQYIAYNNLAHFPFLVKGGSVCDSQLSSNIITPCGGGGCDVPVDGPGGPQFSSFGSPIKDQEWRVIKTTTKLEGDVPSGFAPFFYQFKHIKSGRYLCMYAPDKGGNFRNSGQRWDVGRYITTCSEPTPGATVNTLWAIEEDFKDASGIQYFAIATPWNFFNIGNKATDAANKVVTPGVIPMWYLCQDGSDWYRANNKEPDEAKNGANSGYLGGVNEYISNIYPLRLCPTKFYDDKKGGSYKTTRVSFEVSSDIYNKDVAVGASLTSPAVFSDGSVFTLKSKKGDYLCSDANGEVYQCDETNKKEKTLWRVKKVSDGTGTADVIESVDFATEGKQRVLCAKSDSADDNVDTCKDVYKEGEWHSLWGFTPLPGNYVTLKHLKSGEYLCANMKSLTKNAVEKCSSEDRDDEEWSTLWEISFVSNPYYYNEGEDYCAKDWYLEKEGKIVAGAFQGCTEYESEGKPWCAMPKGIQSKSGKNVYQSGGEESTSETYGDWRYCDKLPDSAFWKVVEEQDNVAGQKCSPDGALHWFRGYTITHVCDKGKWVSLKGWGLGDMGLQEAWEKAQAEKQEKIDVDKDCAEEWYYDTGSNVYGPYTGCDYVDGKNKPRWCAMTQREGSTTIKKYSYVYVKGSGKFEYCAQEGAYPSSCIAKGSEWFMYDKEQKTLTPNAVSGLQNCAYPDGDQGSNGAGWCPKAGDGTISMYVYQSGGVEGTDWKTCGGTKGSTVTTPSSTTLSDVASGSTLVSDVVKAAKAAKAAAEAAKKESTSVTEVCLPLYVAQNGEGTTWKSCAVSDTSTHTGCAQEWYKLQSDGSAVDGPFKGCVSFENEEWCATNVVTKNTEKRDDGKMRYNNGDACTSYTVAYVGEVKGGTTTTLLGDTDNSGCLSDAEYNIFKAKYLKNVENIQNTVKDGEYNIYKIKFKKPKGQLGTGC